MPQKVLVSGYPVSPLRVVRSMMGKDVNAPKVYAFEMEEKGGEPTKYLPRGSKIEFTVFVTEKQLRRAGFEESALSTFSLFKEKKIVVEGELVIDLDMKTCSGDMGITTNQVKIIQPREPNPPKEVSEVKQDMPVQ